MTYPKSIARLITELGRLPGVGPKSAQRLTFHLLARPQEDVRALAEAIWQARIRLRYCSLCHDATDQDQDPCIICSDPARDHSRIVVVEQPPDVRAIERMREYRGCYHVLHGVISPMDGIGPDDLTIKGLLARLKDGQVEEVVLATNPTVEGEATALFLARLLKPLAARTTRIARGLPEGGDLEYADEITLARALEGRRDM